MPVYEKHEPGSFCWAELAVDDPKAVTTFYTGLFGWNVVEQPLPEGGTYYLFNKGGKPVAAATPKFPGQENIPSHWNTYFTTDDAEQSAKRAEAAGGTVLMPAFDVMELGRMAVFTDPDGAVVSVWQPIQMQGAALKHEHGAITWNELMTTDTSKVRDFYTEVFGWTSEDQEMPNGVYTVFSSGDRQEAGMMKMPDGMGAPPAWTVYFGHDDTAAGVEKIKELGGQVMMGPDVIPTVGTIGWATDPQGAVFAFMTPEEWPS